MTAEISNKEKVFSFLKVDFINQQKLFIKTHSVVEEEAK